MTRIKVLCDFCDDPSTITEQDVIVRTNIDDMSYSYRFVCMSCSTIVIKECQGKVANMLVEGGCESEFWKSPKESLSLDGPHFCTDDLIDWHSILDEENFSASLFAD